MRDELGQDGADLRVRASVLSYFDAAWLEPAVGPNVAPTSGATHSERAFLSFLDNACERVRGSDGRSHWRLRDAERIPVLRGLSRAGMRRAIESTTPRPDDAVQTMLERYAAGMLPPLAGLDPADLAALLQLHRWLGGRAGLPDAAAVRRALDWAVLLEPLRRLADGHFTGRAEVLAGLHASVDAGRHGSDLTGIFLQGVGGIGKSTLLARLLLDRHAAGDAVAYLTFDRGWLIDSGPWGLMDELVRQIALQSDFSDATTQRIADLRTRAARSGVRSAARDISSRKSARREPVSDAFMAELADLLRPWRRVLVVLDATEEVARREETTGVRLRETLKHLARAVPAARVVAAGRAVSGTGLEQLPLRDVRGLPVPEAEQLLTWLLDVPVDPAVLREIAVLVEGNPLSLRLAAGVLNRGGEDPARFLDVAQGDVQGQLYSRVLTHVSDPRVRAIAHPGLVVRRLTPQIIREVLSGPCGLGSLDDAGAESIFQALRQEATLCEPSPDHDGALVHREDVRALMLPAIQRDAPTVARAIHHGCVRYYQSAAEGSSLSTQPEGIPETPRASDAPQRGPRKLEARLTSAVARREELYHRLMLGQTSAELDRRWSPAAAGALVRVLPELPIRSQVYLGTKVPGLRVDPAVQEAANQDEWRRIVRPSVLQLIEAGRTQEALALLTERQGPGGRSLLPGLEIEVRERLGYLDSALALARQERGRAEALHDLATMRELILHEARILERRRDWEPAWTLLMSLAALDGRRREGSSVADPTLLLEDLVVLTSLLRIARHRPDVAVGTRASEDGEGDDRRDVGWCATEAARCAEQVPVRLLIKTPGLLRDLAAELGTDAPAVLDLAVEALGGADSTTWVTTVPAPPTARPPGREWRDWFRRLADEAQDYTDGSTVAGNRNTGAGR